MKVFDHLKTIPQYLIPQHGLSVLAGKLADKKNLRIKNWVIKTFAKHYGVDMSIAVEPDLTAYESFNDFFTRAIRPETRPICDDPDTLACPVDGAVSQFGKITNGDIIQAKGHSYTVQDLLGGDAKLAEQFEDGEFITIYLSPKDYHRYHMPIDGKLTRMIHVPGKLFSVNPLTARTVPRLFARNERVVAMFDTDFGPLAYVAVGATIVGSMEMAWSGIVTPPTIKDVSETQYAEGDVTLKRGDEVGRFRLGSTVILLLPKGSYSWDESIKNEAPTLLGQPMVKRH
ncbi:archaetidylserine decarboxylase [Pleionea sediminis]|uniref:archaetidylserine decarboxylase n=1 Tax=Pleionea sediminis TaxID=2569479 RepID=UPI001186ABB9|nr:archaetidylserine decarboxylase [Pleionea sediminis]